MKATILDTVTGKTAVVDGLRSFEWAERNWSCDCNRELVFVKKSTSCVCIGCSRYLVVAAEMNDPEDCEYTLAELNDEYPVELLKAHGIL